MPGRVPEGADPTGFAERHDGLDPSGVWLLPSWLRLIQVLARPLYPVPPDVLTVTGAASAGASLLAAGRGHLLGAAGLAGLSGVLDGIDGAVATATDRVSPHGRALDSGCDRAGEALLLVALARSAALPGGAALTLAASTAVLELGRRRAGTHLRLTAWERPSRVLLAVVGLAAAADRPRRAGHGRTTAGVGLALALVALAQLGRDARRKHSGPGSAR